MTPAEQLTKLDAGAERIPQDGDHNFNYPHPQCETASWIVIKKKNDLDN